MRSTRINNRKKIVKLYDGFSLQAAHGCTKWGYIILNKLFTCMELMFDISNIHIPIIAVIVLSYLDEI